MCGFAFVFCDHIALDVVESTCPAGMALSCPKHYDCYAPCPKAGGVFRTAIRPTLCSDGSSLRVCISTHPQGMSCSDLGGVLVLNDPPARRWRGSGLTTWTRAWAGCATRTAVISGTR